MLSRNSAGSMRGSRLPSLIGLALLMFGLVPDFPIAVAPNTNTFVTFGIPSACILLAMVMLESQGYRIKSLLLLLLGDASYSMYLFHYFVVALLHSSQ